MARIISSHGRSFVHDLVWTRLPDGAESTLAANAGGAAMAVTVSAGEMEISAGFLHTEGLEPKTLKRPVSFAALIATLFKSASSVLLFVTIDESDDAIMVACKNGAPVPDYDRYGLRDDLVGMARSYQRDNPGCRIVSNTSMFEDADDFELAGFLDNPATKKLFAKATLREIGKSNLSLYLILALGLFMGYIGYEHYAEMKRQEEAAKQAALQPSPAMIYAQAMPDAIASEGLNPPDAAAMIQAIGNLDITAKGWRITKVQCSAAGCNATWSRIAKTATFEGLLEGFGSKSFTLMTDQSAVQSLPMKVGKAVIDTTRLKSEQDVWRGLLSPMQRLGPAISFSVTPATPFQAGGVTPSPGAISRGQLQIQGPLWLMESIQGLPAYALVREFSVAPNPQGAAFVMSVIYFVR